MNGMKQVWRWILVAGGVVLAALVWLVAAGAQDARIVYVYSENCGYCTTFTPTFEKVMADYPDWQVEKLDVNQQADLDRATEMGATATPTVFLLKDGKVIDRLEGDVPESAFRKYLERNKQSGYGN
ncbi:thioredoxin domain-containing protein [Brevibacillus sp. SAFN-007a]|uniref:thioredoxin family protein n=1 Tax=Brevibacillus sp. SAFN-007a TaxID=3436862 RepID=UPI003F81C881